MTGDTQDGVVERLIDLLGRLPGIGAKSAERLAHHLLKSSVEDALALAEAIRAVKERMGYCLQCHHLTEAGRPKCPICDDARRDPTVICVVEQPRDLMALERSGSFRGLYHVLLGRLSPLSGVGPEQLTIDSLVRRVQETGVREVILATNPNLEGDATAMLVSQRLELLDVVVTKLARGLQSGGFLEFANKEMLADAVSGRRKF
ncbi:MAG: recombination mediator RecR [Planctomycetota bacterium]|nr:recombination mediator RecR [Planctomycetota bacterium]